MTHIAHRLMATKSYEIECAAGCHTTGEPGVRDGGFTHVLGQLGLSARDVKLDAWDSLPRDLRRLASAGCLACHGPAAIPEPSARHAILRSDVCATCHDAPPRYGHVVAWQSTAMSQADRDPTTRSGSCAVCHTSHGFLGAPSTGADRAPPEHVGVGGLGCAVCHAVHPAGDQPGVASLRKVSVPERFGPPGLGASRVCVPCHSPSAELGTRGFPAASAAALLLGRGGLDPQTGEPLDGDAPHSFERGCLACHAEGPEGLERGTGHAFKATRNNCPLCHATDLMPTADLQAQALALLRRAIPEAESDRPLHAQSIELDLTVPRGRAAYNAALVVGDRAAADHNPRYARALLDSARAALAGNAQP